MVGRGAVGNPFVFKEIAARLDGEDFTPPSLEVRAMTALRQLEYAIADKGEAVAIPEARKQTALYLKGFRGAAAIRAEINRALTLDEARRALESALK
jgi:tRNA-dihydrouridine synthase